MSPTEHLELASNRGIRFCRNCTHPNTRPRIEFTADGLCNGCVRAEEKKRIDWEARARAFKQIVTEACARSPNREYDCIIPVSGGKDSVFQTWYAINTLGLHPLCVNISAFLPTRVGVLNLRNIAEKLDADVISITPNQKVFGKLARYFLEHGGDPFVPFLFALFGQITRIAIEKRIPLFLFGENGDVEYGGSRDPTFGTLDSRGIVARIRSDKRSFLEPSEWTKIGLTEEEVRIYQVPSDEEVRQAGLQHLFFSDYTPWSNNHHMHVALNIVGGFQMNQERSPGTFTYGSSTDDDLYDLYVWLMWPKFGFCRATKYTSKDIHEGKITRPEAIKLVAEYDGEFPWRALDRFCAKTGLLEEEFWKIVARHVADVENIQRDHPGGERLPIWEKVGANRWRLIAAIHGEDRYLELPPPRPDGSSRRKNTASELPG